MLEARVLLSGSLVVSDPATWEYRSEPPPGYVYIEQTPTASGESGEAGVTKTLTGVPEYFWYHGCSPTSVGMLMGYWDGLAYPNYIPGSNDWATNQAAIQDAIASAGHIADYVPTPDRVPPPDYHTDDCIADFLHTSRDPEDHGSTDPANIPPGMEEYASFRGYTHTNAWAEDYGSFTFADLQAQIDAGRPMVFGVDTDGDGYTDHFIPVFGYRTSPTNQFACYTTWAGDPGLHWFDFTGMSAGHNCRPRSIPPTWTSTGTRPTSSATGPPFIPWASAARSSWPCGPRRPERLSTRSRPARSIRSPASTTAPETAWPGAPPRLATP